MASLMEKSEERDVQMRDIYCQPKSIDTYDCPVARYLDRRRRSWRYLPSVL